MTHPLVEQVARALCKALYPHADIEQPAMRWDHVDGVMMPTDQPMWTDHVDDARAAIAAFLDAVREPSEGMIQRSWFYDGSIDVWPAMIDALRAELLPPPGDA